MKSVNENPETLVCVREYDVSVFAEMAKSVLDAAGIMSVIHGELMSAIYANGAFPSRLMVASKDYDEADRLLSAGEDTIIL